MTEESTASSAADVIEMAIQMERAGERFYRTAADAADDPGQRPVRTLLIKLALDEQAHAATFRTMREAMADEPWFDGEIDPDDETARFIRQWASDQVFGEFGSEARFAEELRTPRQALDRAIEIEQASIRFYRAMLDLIPDDRGSDWLRDILRQETQHVAFLRRAIDEQP